MTRTIHPQLWWCQVQPHGLTKSTLEGRLLPGMHHLIGALHIKCSCAFICLSYGLEARHSILSGTDSPVASHPAVLNLVIDAVS